MLHKLLMLFPSYRQRERIAQYLIDLKTQNATLLFVLLHQKDMTIDFSYEDHICRFFLPCACYDSIQNTIASTSSFYEAGLLRKVRPYLREGMVYADIGANIGNHVVFFSKVCNAEKGYAFEPQKHVFEILRRNVTINDLSEKVELHNVCLGKSKGTCAITSFQTDNCGGTSFRESPKGAYNVLSLDSLEIPRIDFIKIDVEGAEMDVLLGAEKTISEKRPVVWCEALNRESLKRLIQFFRRYGYIRRKISDTDFLFIPEENGDKHT